MNKDVIYIDVEDDITAIIGKVKAANERIVALVPPKRIGVLQSAVNLRLLVRAASGVDKRIVLITSNPALTALSASAKIPVAKNLQSKPELAEITALQVDDGDDMIDGAQLPISEHAKTSPATKKAIEAAEAVDSGTADDKGNTTAPSYVTPAQAELGAAATAASKKKIKVPNFGSFRKKLFIGIGAGALLVGFLVWAIVFAPRATVIITARTNVANVNQAVAISPDAKTDFSSKTIKSIVQQQKKQLSVEFDATGKKNIGDNAKGTVKLSKLAQSDTTIPAGTQLTSSNGLVFTTDSTAIIPASVPCFPTYCSQSTTVTVTAGDKGTTYNGVSGNLNGAPSGASAAFTGATSGGTDKIAAVVTAFDIQNATTKLAEQTDTSVKSALINQLKVNSKVIDDSYLEQKSDPVSSPAVDTEATGKAKITQDVTYSMTAIPTEELKVFFEAALSKQLDGQASQHIYNNGVDTVAFTQYAANTGAATVNVAAKGQVGPKIDDEAVKTQVQGKRYGEVQSSLESIDGVDSVDVQFSPFWVRTVPKDNKKITIEFKLQDASN